MWLKYIKTKPILEQKVHTWTINILSLVIAPSIKKQQLKKYNKLSSSEQEKYLNQKQKKTKIKVER